MAAFYRTVKVRDWPWIAKFHPGASVISRPAPQGKVWVRFVGDNFQPIVPVEITVPDHARIFCDEIAGASPVRVRPAGGQVVRCYRTTLPRAAALRLL